MVATVPTSTTLTVEMGSNESGSGADTSGGIRVKHFYTVGPATEAKGSGWGLGQWGGTVSGEVTSTLDGAINSSATSLTLADSDGFSSSGTLLIDSELITYTANDTSTEGISGITRAAYLTPLALTKWCKAVVLPVKVLSPSCSQPPIFSGVP